MGDNEWFISALHILPILYISNSVDSTSCPHMGIFNFQLPTIFLYKVYTKSDW